MGINESALRGFSGDEKNTALNNASRLMDGYFRSRFTLPLVQVGADVRMKCSFIAAYLLLVGRGFNPEKGSDAVIVKNYDDALKWLAGVRDEQLTPDVTDSSPAAVEGEPSFRARMVSSSSRGWSRRTTTTCDPGDFQGD